MERGLAPAAAILSAPFMLAGRGEALSLNIS
jgi:hypothetical protein